MMARILNGLLLLLSLLLALLLAACGSFGMNLHTATPMPIVIECAGDPTCVNAFALLELWGLTSLEEIQRQVVRLPDSLRIVEGEPPMGNPGRALDRRWPEPGTLPEPERDIDEVPRRTGGCGGFA